MEMICWYFTNSGSQTHAVSEKEPNSLGLYDMQGNVWEWCNDWWQDYYNDNSEIILSARNLAPAVLTGAAIGGL